VQAYLSAKVSSRRICTFVLARTSFPNSSRVIESFIQMTNLSVTEAADFEGARIAEMVPLNFLFHEFAESRGWRER